MRLREIVALRQRHHGKTGVGGFHRIAAEACPSKAFGCQAHIIGGLQHLGVCLRCHCSHHAIFELIDVALKQSHLAAFTQSVAKRILHLAQFEHTHCMLIVGPCAFHLCHYLFCHQVAITLAACHLHTHKAVLIEWREQRPERLLHTELIIVLEFAVQLAPRVSDLRRSQFPRLALGGADACYVAVNCL